MAIHHISTSRAGVGAARWGRRARLWLVARISGPRGWTLPPWPVTTVCSSEAEGKLGAELSFLSPSTLPCQPGLTAICGDVLAAQCTQPSTSESLGSVF